MTLLGLALALAWSMPTAPAAPPVSRAEAERPPSTLDTLARLEWRRAEPSRIAVQIAGGTTEERVVGIRALGRLRDPEALPILASWRDDPEVAVQIAVAAAMGFTPRSEADLRTWLAELIAARPTVRGATLPLGLLSAPRPGDELLTAVITANGRGGDARSVALLVELLDDGWPVAGSAARALGTLGVRGTPGLDVATAGLIAATSDPDPRTQGDAAWALARIKPPLGEATGRVVARIRSGIAPEARAWLVRGAWPSLSASEREDLFLWAMTDAPRLVQVAVLQALGPDDTEAVVIAPFLADADPWVRSATIDALARVGGEVAEEALARLASGAATPDERAHAVAALNRPDPEAVADASLPLVVRAAHVGALRDPARWIELALHDPEPVLRTAAASALSEASERPADAGAKLLAAEDPLVRAVAVDLLPKDPAGLQALVALLAAEEDHEVRGAAWTALDAHLADAKALPQATKAAVLARIAEAERRDSGPAAPHVEALAQRLGAPPVQVPKVVLADEVRVSVGDGGTAPITLGASELADVRRIRGAVVTTDQGSFVIRLEPEVAPLAVASFAQLAEAHWFDGVVFHRVVPGFVAQTGDPRGDGWGGPGYELPDEDSELPFDLGAVGMARSERDTGGSQWFVTTSPQPHLQGEYTRFGQVVQGLSVVTHLPQGAVIRAVTLERLDP